LDAETNHGTEWFYRQLPGSIIRETRRIVRFFLERPFEVERTYRRFHAGLVTTCGFCWGYDTFRFGPSAGLLGDFASQKDLWNIKPM
jgi:hypothetical protein